MTLEHLFDPLGRLLAATIWFTLFVLAIALTLAFSPLLLAECL